MHDPLTGALLPSLYPFL